jgi:hypothetical protein
MTKLIAFFKRVLFRQDSFYYHAEEVRFEEQAEQARLSYAISFKKAS